MLIAPACSAQLRIEIAGVGSSQIPVAIAAFADEDMTQQITSIIKDDLNRSGYFKIIEAGAVITETSTG
jgi:TolB protein